VAVFGKLKAGEIAKEAIPEVLKAFAAEPGLAIENAIRKTKIVALTLDDLRAIIRKTIEKNRELAGEPRGEKVLLGLVMQVVRGKIDPQIVMDELGKELRRAK
jgi:Glu-tRNA(Gln) amidotransferase subunit E-like FAD-binding protein